MKDVFANFVQDPIQDAAMETVVGHATGGALGDAGAAEELAGNLGLGDELDGMGDDAMGGFADQAGDAVGGFAEDVGEGATEIAQELFGFFGDLFGSE